MPVPLLNLCSHKQNNINTLAHYWWHRHYCLCDELPHNNHKIYYSAEKVVFYYNFTVRLSAQLGIYSIRRIRRPPSAVSVAERIRKDR